MTVKTIFACLTRKASADAVLNAACILARRHEAHLVGLHVVEGMFVNRTMAMHIPESVHEAYDTSQDALSDELKSIFERHTHAEDFVSEWRLMKTTDQPASERISDLARVADLLIMAVDDDVFPPSQRRLKEEVIRECGRPVLVVPGNFDGDDLGRLVLIGWNGSREAARSAHDALTLLKPGDQAHILRIRDDLREEDEQDDLTRDLAAAFARYGVTTSMSQKSWQQPGIAAALYEEAATQGADMIAVGAFGHSRAYDFIVGAASRDLLRDTDLPVLFSR